jgi:ATP-binding cassette subfamily F protein uup
VIEAKHIGKSYGERKIVDDFSARVTRGDRIGIVGPNGAGKTTLIGLLTGGDTPDTGTVRLGANLEMVTLDQHRESLDPKTTLADALTGGRGDSIMVNGTPKHVIGYMKDFLFASEQARTPLEVLSGGERGRLMLARALAKPSNFLVLDEPTNDLDLETLDVLEEMLSDYQGTVILVSHDRDFLDRVVTSVIAPEGDGKWNEYAGGYSDMLVQRGADLQEKAIKATGSETAKASKNAATAPSTAAKRRLSFNEKHALETLPKPCRSFRLKLPSGKSCSTIRSFIQRTARHSTRHQQPLPRHRQNWMPPKRNGWNWKCCARKSRAAPSASDTPARLFPLQRLSQNTPAADNHRSALPNQAFPRQRIRRASCAT